jgi:hypothetical protein
LHETKGYLLLDQITPGIEGAEKGHVLRFRLVGYGLGTVDLQRAGWGAGYPDQRLGYLVYCSGSLRQQLPVGGMDADRDLALLAHKLEGRGPVPVLLPRAFYGQRRHKPNEGYGHGRRQRDASDLARFSPFQRDGGERDPAEACEP